MVIGKELASVLRRLENISLITTLFCKKKKKSSKLYCNESIYDTEKSELKINSRLSVKNAPSTNTTEVYRMVHISFQSTSSCYASTANALRQCKLSVMKQE